MQGDGREGSAVSGSRGGCRCGHEGGGAPRLHISKCPFTRPQLAEADVTT